MAKSTVPPRFGTLARMAVAKPTLQRYDHIQDNPSHSVVRSSPMVPPMFPPELSVDWQDPQEYTEEDKTPVCNFKVENGRLVSAPPNVDASPFPSVHPPAEKTVPECPAAKVDWLAAHTQKRGTLHQVMVGLVVVATLVGLTLAVVYTVINHNNMQRHIDEYNHRQEHMGEP